MLIERRAKATLTAVEMDVGDTLKFTLRNGQTRTLTLEHTAAAVLATNLKKLKHARGGGGTLLHFTCRVAIDGQPTTLERIVGAQESFYEPIVVNGMRLWLDAVADLFDFVTEKHGDCRPSKAARFAVHDARDPICPQEILPWYPSQANFIDVRNCYCGDDCWLGAYQGADAHGGLDVNMPKGTPHWAPIDFDDHFYFNSLAMGHNNNRWRAIRRWPDGSAWTLQSHHLIKLLVPEHTPLKAGTHYAEAAGVHVGAHEHSHFVFKVTNDASEVLLDPWILFWQTFEHRRQRAGELRAAMAPLSPATTGQPTRFQSLTRGEPCSWTFGDGAAAEGPKATHIFPRPGVYPVTLTVGEGERLAAFTQHITVGGKPVSAPCLTLGSADEPSFRPRPAHATDVYGIPIPHPPHTVQLLARENHPRPRPRTLILGNTGGGTLARAAARVEHQDGEKWLAASLEGTGNGQWLVLRADATGLEPGTYTARVVVECQGALNSPQACRVALHVKDQAPAPSPVTVTTRDAGFFATPHFWVCPGYHTWPKGASGRILTNGGRPRAGEFVRFTPDLTAGRWEVALSPKTPFAPQARFAVRIRHTGGDETLWIEPTRSRRIGIFRFDEGTDGFIELLAEGSKAPVLADAVVFTKADE